MSTVFLVQRQFTYDRSKGVYVQKLSGLSDAESFGQVREIFAPNDPLHDISLVKRRTLDLISEFSEDDYLLPAGNLIACLIVSSILFHRFDGRLKILVWSPREKRYSVTSLEDF